MTDKDYTELAYKNGYEQGQWRMFQLVTSAEYGKQVYFLEPNGIIYSRVSNTHLKDREEAYKEYFSEVGKY